MKYLFDWKEKINENELNRVIEILKNDGIALLPTETVYGLAANALSDEASEKIFLAKGRAQDNPLIVHVASIEMVEKLVEKIGTVEQKLMEKFWPGPLTIIMKRKSKKVVPNVTTANLDTVGIRMPSNQIAQKLIEKAGLPIAAPSANISGKPSGTNINDIFDELSSKVDCIIDGGTCEVGLESTVVRVIDGIPTILRPGKITPEQIKNVAGTVKIDKHIFSKLEENEKVLSPGMKYRHYAPNSKCVLVYSKDNDLLVNKIKEIAVQYTSPLILSSTENKSFYGDNLVIDIGSKFNLNEIAKNIFTILRKVDSFSPDIVIIEGVAQEGLGLAIMNRLIRACEYNYVEV